MSTLVVSDLHIGTAGTDLVRRPELRAPLLERLAAGDIDRLVILGDALELREVPVHAVVAAAEPVFADFGAALPKGAEIVVAAGNHDHQLLTGWFEERADQGDGPLDRLGLAQTIEPAAAGPIAERLAAAAGTAKLSLCYPGIWLRDDVFALHGHYLDMHTPVPTMERLAAGAMSRLLSPLPEDVCTPDDYEAVLAPLYAWMFAVAQRSTDAARAGSRGSASAWNALAGKGRQERPLRAAALLTGLRGAVAALNRAGLGPVRPQISGAALRRGSLEGLAEVLRRLEVPAQYVVFGHTHRSGPWPEDDHSEWVTAAGTRLVNTGSWVYQPHFLPKRPGAGPYWPGVAVRIDADGPPVLERLLGERGHDELRPRARG